MTPVRYLICELDAHTFVREKVVTAIGEIETIENDQYRLFLFTDLLLYTRIKEKGKLKYANRIYLDKLRVTDIVGKESTKNSF